jgi:hypothetical protein
MTHAPQGWVAVQSPILECPRPGTLCTALCMRDGYQLCVALCVRVPANANTPT